MPVSAVQEVQGLYGPFSISENIIQKIWLQGDFYQEALETTSGKRLRILDPGAWNKNEGPDFKEARLEIEGCERVGDVEIHFYPNDWFHHGHDRNPNFRNVILHVVLYAGTAQDWDASFPMESLTLLPLLERDLEEYAMEAALLDLEQVNELDWFEPFMEKPLAERRSWIEELSKKRWGQKAAFAGKRLQRADWHRCCHESTLEVLGFARNRSPMHTIAARYSIADFSSRLDTDSVFEELGDDWRLSGCRPANHPKLRLRQYQRICQANPDWPERLAAHLEAAAAPQAGDTADFRKACRTRELQTRIAEEVFQETIGSKRLNSLLCDAIFPLAAGAIPGRWQAYWQHWYPGDFPEAFARFHRQAGLGDARFPISNGLMQGILALFASQGAGLDVL
jgi:hypothetical protein